MEIRAGKKLYDEKRTPGKAVLIRRDGKIEFADCLEPAEKRSCVFERIYFSRPNDAGIHRERKLLGKSLY